LHGRKIGTSCGFWIVNPFRRKASIAERHDAGRWLPAADRRLPAAGRWQATADPRMMQAAPAFPGSPSEGVESLG
jgi:hypothetical protein